MVLSGSRRLLDVFLCEPQGHLGQNFWNFPRRSCDSEEMKDRIGLARCGSLGWVMALCSGRELARWLPLLAT